MSLFGIPLWYFSQSPRVVIQVSGRRWLELLFSMGSVSVHRSYVPSLAELREMNMSVELVPQAAAAFPHRGVPV